MINKFIQSIKESDTGSLKDLISNLNLDSDDVTEINCFFSNFDAMFEDEEENTYYHSLRYTNGGALVYIIISNGIVSAVEEVYGYEDMDPQLKLDTDINVEFVEEQLNNILREKRRDLLEYKEEESE